MPEWMKEASAPYRGRGFATFRAMEGEKMNNKQAFDTRQLVLLAMLTAIVAVLQFLGAFIKFGPFSISLVLMPIAVGAALLGAWAGAWLGLAFGFVVLLTGDANVFMAIDPLGTLVIVLVKGTAAGFFAGVAYRAIAKMHKTIAAIVAAAICPVANTGFFVLGCYVFFLPTITAWGEAAGFANASAFLFLGMVGGNFIVELALNLILSPAITRLIQYGQDRRAGTA